VLAATGAAVAISAAVVGVGMFGAVVVQMLMVVGMLVGMFMSVVVSVGMGHTVVGMFVGVGMGMGVVMMVTAHMIVIQMHNDRSFMFLFYYNDSRRQSQ
jgi:hypothetical protein